MVGSVFRALGRVYGGAAYSVGSMFIHGAGQMVKGLGILERQTMSKTLHSGNLVPYKLRKGLGGKAFLGLTAVGAGVGIFNAGSVDPEKALDKNSGLPYSDIPGTVGRYISPTAESMANKKGIDDLGATGDLVFALNNRR